MTGLDERLLAIGGEHGSLLIALVVALLLGLRHATDPDHLTALSTLVLADDRHGARNAGRLGLAWGAGHAATLLALGMPVVFWNAAIPDWAQRVAEGTVGAVIVLLAVRLLVRWRRGYFHTHTHEHDGGVRHAHPHVHELAAETEHEDEGSHAHVHREPGTRSQRAAFVIGLIHGAGGSAGVGILLIAGIGSRAQAIGALVVFAAGTALSMTAVSALWGRFLTIPSASRRLALLAPVFGTAGLTFGCWFATAAVVG